MPAPWLMRVAWFESFSPEADRLVGDENTSLGQLVLDITVAEVEPIVAPDGVPSDFMRKSVTFVWSNRLLHWGDGRAFRPGLAVRSGYPSKHVTAGVVRVRENRSRLAAL